MDLLAMTREQIIAEWQRVVQPQKNETLKKATTMITEILAKEYPDKVSRPQL